MSPRVWARVWALVGTLLFAASARAEEVGSWRFSDDQRPTKVVVVGGSVSAYPAGSFAQWLPSACDKIEVVNRGQAKLGAFELRQRFISQVLKNRRVEKDHNLWLVFLGGLNSVGNPDKTNLEVGKTMKAAKEAGLSTMLVSINPWGAETDRRWKGLEGIAYWEHTQRTVDFGARRLTPDAALGRHKAELVDAEGKWLPGVMPDVSIDVWDSRLRHIDAPLRDTTRLEKEAKRSAWLKKRLASATDPEAEKARLIAQASELPRWFMRPELMAFDAIHPNAEGHKLIARAICAKAPSSWGCHCERLDALAWDRRLNAPKAL
jgi:hypothetical protein